MQQNDVILQKERDFSQIFNDIVIFFQQNWRRLFYLIMIYAGPFLLIDGIVSAYTNSFLFGSMPELFRGDMYSYSQGPEFLTKLFTWYGIMILVKMIAYTFLITITYGYMSLYAERGKNFDLNEVRPLALSYFFPVMFGSLLILLIVAIGIVFCIIPGIYLGICLTFVFAIMLIEKKSFGYAFSQSFRMAHKDFWWTFLIVLAVGFAVGMLSFLISLPMTGSNFMMIFTRAVGDQVDQSQSVLNIMLTTVTTIIMSLVTIFPMIAVSLQYFNIVEREKKRIQHQNQTA